MVKVIASLVAIVWAVSLGGVNAGKIIGAIAVGIITLIVVITWDAQKYKKDSRTWTEAIKRSLKENAKYIVK